MTRYRSLLLALAAILVLQPTTILGGKKIGGSSSSSNSHSSASSDTNPVYQLPKDQDPDHASYWSYRSYFGRNFNRRPYHPHLESPQLRQHIVFTATQIENALWSSMLDADDERFYIHPIEKSGSYQDGQSRSSLFIATTLHEASANFPVSALSTPRDLTPIIFSALPNNIEEFHKVFGKPPTNEQAKIISKISIPGSFEVLGSNLIEDIRNSSSDLIIIVGHNQNGYLQTPDGLPVQISDIVARCALEGKLCIIIACRSSYYIPTPPEQPYDIPLTPTAVGLVRSIEATEAVSLATNIKKLVESIPRERRQRGLVFNVVRERISGTRWAKAEVVSVTSEGRIVVGVILGTAIACATAAAVAAVFGDDDEPLPCDFDDEGDPELPESVEAAQ